MSPNDIQQTETADEQEGPLQAPEASSEPRDPDSGVSAPENGPQAPGEATEDSSEDQGQDDEATGNREAARYRKRLRDTEAERDALSARLETMQRHEAERLASKVLAKGSALWAGETKLDDLLDDDGNIDPQKVTDRAEEVREEFGIARARRPLVVPMEGYSPAVPHSTGSMVDVVMGKHP